MIATFFRFLAGKVLLGEGEDKKGTSAASDLELAVANSVCTQNRWVAELLLTNQQGQRSVVGCGQLLPKMYANNKDPY